ncbi:MAG: glycosyltransferase family 4 protein, partial [Candidatus Poribacteria bacterium]
MNIVILCAYFQPELGYREYYYARNLAKLGHEVNVITSDRILFIRDWENIAKSIGCEVSRYRKIGRSEIDGFMVYRTPVLFEYDRFIVPYGIKKILLNIKPDVVHIIENGFVFSFPAAIYKKSLNCGLIYEIEFSLTSTHLLRSKEYYEYYFFKKPIIKYLVRKADRLNICTDEVSEFFYKHISESKEKINRMSLGADPDFFYENYKERQDLRVMMNIADDEVLIVTSGKIELHKRYDVLIKSISSIKNEYPKIKFLIIGSGAESAIKNILDIAQNEGIKENIILKPFAKRDELRKFYNASDIGVWTRATITILEAMGCGLPV